MRFIFMNIFETNLCSEGRPSEDAPVIGRYERFASSLRVMKTLRLQEYIVLFIVLYRGGLICKSTFQSDFPGKWYYRNGESN